MDLTAGASALAEVVSAATRLLSGPVLLCARGTEVTVSGADHERAVRLDCAANVHTDGTVLVPGAPLAETLRMLDSTFVRLIMEGSRLAVRVEGARFALPLLDIETHPGLTEPPPEVAQVGGAMLAAALHAVAGVAAREDSLPMFTGVRLHLADDRLQLVASDRYRMAVARVPLLAGQEPFDVVVPARLLTEAAKQLHGPVVLHAEHARFGLSWAGRSVTTAVFDGGSLSPDTIQTSTVDTTVEVDADTLAAAVRRVGVFADGHRVVTLQVGDAQIRLASAKEDTGEAEETIKAEVSGGRTSPSFQVRHLLDALRLFSGHAVRLDIQPGLRASIVRAVAPGDVELTYLTMPMLSRP
jgi:DNA polymerase III subunit beta